MTQDHRATGLEGWGRRCKGASAEEQVQKGSFKVEPADLCLQILCLQSSICRVVAAR